MNFKLKILILFYLIAGCRIESENQGELKDFVTSSTRLFSVPLPHQPLFYCSYVIRDGEIAPVTKNALHEQQMQRSMQFAPYAWHFLVNSLASASALAAGLATQSVKSAGAAAAATAIAGYSIVGIYNEEDAENIIKMGAGTALLNAVSGGFSKGHLIPLLVSPATMFGVERQIREVRIETLLDRYDAQWSSEKTIRKFIKNMQRQVSYAPGGRCPAPSELIPKRATRQVKVSGQPNYFP